MTIQEVFEELNIEHLETGHHHCRPGWVQLDCPFCGRGSRKFHLGYNISRGYFSCWKCGPKFANVVLQKYGIPRKKAEELLSGINTAYGPRKRERSRVSLQEPKGIGPLHPAHIRYLEGRGFDPIEIQRVWSIQGIAMAPQLRWRIYIPVIQGGMTVTWTTRAIGDKVADRYISASQEQEVINIKECVYGLDLCYHSVIIVEGPADAWAIGPGAGAVFGTAFTTAQVRKLIQIPNRYVCFDSSPSAQREAQKLCDQLSMFPGRTENIELDAKDPGEASKKEIRLLRRHANLF